MGATLGLMTRGPSEINRLVLTKPALRAILQREVEARLQAAAELEALGERERAQALLSQVSLARGYVSSLPS